MKKFIILLILLFSGYTYAQQLAFPTAMGAGAYSTGGRDGKIVHVTNLSGSQIEGSLLWAIYDSENYGVKKQIVFDVSGVITLSDNITVADYSGFAHGLTLAGQTAPLGGITITGGKLRMFGIDDVIVRYMKFRETGGTDGCISNQNGDRVIFDHLSLSNSPDVLAALTSNGDVSFDKTFQHNLLGNSKNGFMTGDTTPDNNVKYEDCSVLRNVYSNIGWRCPVKSGGAQIGVDVINNITHRWSKHSLRIDDWSMKLNHIGNYYQNSGATYNFRANNYYTGTPQIYLHDNYLDPRVASAGYTTDETVDWVVYQQDYTPVPSNYFTSTQHPILGNANYEIYDSSQLMDSVLPKAGAYKYIKDDGTVGEYRDIYDLEIINDVLTDDYSVRSRTIATPITSLSNTRPANFYASNPHIPEAYLDTRVSDLTVLGVTKTDTDVHNTIMPSGYTLFEDYINQVDSGEEPEATLPTTVTITPNDPTINIPDTVGLGLIWNTTTPTDQTGTWQSSNGSVATVDSNGLVTPVSVGTAVITFTANAQDENSNTVYDTVTVAVTNVVTDVVSVEVSPDTISMGTNETRQLSINFTPSNSSDQTGVWSSSATGVATIDSSGLITPVAEGTATITFTANDTANGTITGTSVITVTTATTPQAATLDSVVIDGNTYILTFSVPSGTEEPFGNYNTYVTSSETGNVRENQDDNADFTGFTRSISGLNMTIPQTFEVDARYLQYNPSQFYMSNAITVQPVTDTTNPTTPTNAIVNNINNTTATVTWTASTDDNLIGYRIKDGATILSSVTGGEAYNFIGLTADTFYSYSIVAYDSVGNESTPLLFSFTTTSSGNIFYNLTTKQKRKSKRFLTRKWN